MRVTSVFTFSQKRGVFGISVIFNVSSAAAFNFDQSRNLSFGKELNCIGWGFVEGL